MKTNMIKSTKHLLSIAKNGIPDNTFYPFYLFNIKKWLKISRGIECVEKSSRSQTMLSDINDQL